MDLLLDEQIDVRLKGLLLVNQADWSVTTVQDRGWVGMKNGELREQLNQAGFRFFVTADKNMPFQQNMATTAFCLVLLDTPTLLWVHQQQFAEKLLALLSDPPSVLVKLVHISVDGLSRGKKIPLLQRLLQEDQLLFL